MIIINKVKEKILWPRFSLNIHHRHKESIFMNNKYKKYSPSDVNLIHLFLFDALSWSRD